MVISMLKLDGNNLVNYQQVEMIFNCTNMIYIK